ncbi:MAG: hypothetical protein ACXW07_07670 [Nitrososphaeraceae archaeon]
MDYLAHTDNQARIVFTGTSTGGLDNAALPTGYETPANGVDVSDHVQSFVTSFTIHY